MTTKFRAGVIGAGGISNNHIRGYLDTGRFDIVALADLNESELLVRGKSAEFAAMFAKQTAYRLFSEACGSAMTLSNLPESLPMPGPQRAVA